MKKLILLVVFLMAIAVPYASAAAELPPDPGLLIHWKFDNSLVNSGSAGSSYNLPMPTSPPPSYTTGLDSGALVFSKDDSSILTTVMNKIATLPLTNATISFNIKQGTSWNNFIILADSNASAPSLSLYVNGILIHSVVTTDPIAVLKSPTFTNTWLKIKTSLLSGAIDDFRVFNYIVNNVGINALSQPVLFNQVNTDGSANVSINEIVNYMNTNNNYDPAIASRLLKLIKPIL